MKYLLNISDEEFEYYNIPSNKIIEITLNVDNTLKNVEFIDYENNLQ